MRHLITPRHGTVHCGTVYHGTVHIGPGRP